VPVDSAGMSIVRDFCLVFCFLLARIQLSAGDSSETNYNASASRMRARPILYLQPIRIADRFRPGECLNNSVDQTFLALISGGMGSPQRRSNGLSCTKIPMRLTHRRYLLLAATSA